MDAMHGNYLISKRDEKDQTDPIDDAERNCRSEVFTETWNSLCNLTDTHQSVLLHNCNNITLINSLANRESVKSIELFKPDKKLKQQVSSNKLTWLKDTHDFTAEGQKEYDLIFDQGVNEKASEFYNQVDQILKNGGMYISAFYIYEENSLKKRAFSFLLKNYDISFSISKIIDSQLPLLVLTMTKGTKLAGDNKAILRMDDKIEKLEFLKVIEKLQTYYINNSKSIREIHSERRVSYEIYSDSVTKNIAKYALHMCDHPDKAIAANKSMACFVCPQGKEKESLYCTREGNFELARMVNVSRLMIAVLNPGVPFTSFEQIQKDLESIVLDLKPTGILGNIFFLTDGENAGDRKAVYEDKEIVIEDVKSKVTDVPRRRMVVVNNSTRVHNVIQLRQCDAKNGEESSQEQWGMLEAKKGSVADKDIGFCQ